MAISAILMNINIYITNPNADTVEHSSYWMLKFLEGLKAHGLDVNVVKRGTPDIECDLSIIWGILYNEVTEYHRANNSNFLVVERGYTPNRSEWATAGFNGLNGLAEFNFPYLDASRWRKYHADTMLPWNPEGEYVLILGQTNGDTALYGKDINKWAKKVQGYYEYLKVPYIYRQHPGTARTMFEDSMPDLDEAIDNASCVVTYNSSGGVASILRGKPTISMHRGSMVWDVSLHNLDSYDKMYMPARGQWAENFAFTQWREEEFASGEAWEHLKGYFKEVV